MSRSNIEIVDWGKSAAPMVIMAEGKTILLEMHILSNKALDRLADHAGKRQNPSRFHLGFYGYLRVCDTICTERAGVSILDLAHANWRDFYDEHLLAHEAVDRELKENGYQV